MSEARLVRRCVAHPSKECRWKERVTNTAMDGGTLSHPWRPIARLPNVSDRLDDGLKPSASALAY
jgi:hypothetical protein